MRVRRISGVKRVTMVDRTAPRRHVISLARDVAGERLRFTVIKPDGDIQRGSLRMDIGPVKKERGMLKPVERRLRRLVRAEHRALGRYLVLHERSRRKRRSGWARDLPKNVVRVIRRSF
ncbi:MAG: hypothetical protein ACM3JG_13160 [Thiohalocapsa sp.]